MRIFAASAVFLLSLSTAYAETAGTVTALHGAATAVKEGQETGLAQGDTIEADHLLRTGPQSRLEILLNDGATLHLGAQSEVLVDDFVYRPDAGEGALLLRLTKGAMRAVSGNIEALGGPGSVAVETPVATIGIRGTDLFAHHTDRLLRVALLDGVALEVRNEDGTTILEPGQGTEIVDAGQPSAARLWPDISVEQALHLTTVAGVSGAPARYRRPAVNRESLADALLDGTPALDLRYRVESNDNAAFPRAASASTIRLRALYETAEWNHLGILLEGLASRRVFGNRYADGVGRDPSGVPTLADAEAERVQQAALSWRPRTGTLVRLGRQELVRGDERWLAKVGFAQNGQSFDALSVGTDVLGPVDLHYMIANQVLTSRGNDHPQGSLSGLVQDLALSVDAGFARLTGWGQWLDMDARDDISRATYGVTVEGAVVPAAGWRVGYVGEAAWQTGHGGSVLDDFLGTARVALDVRRGPVALKPNLTWIEGNGTHAVQFPIGAGHKFLGMTDRFSAIPSNGLREMALDAQVSLKSWLPSLWSGRVFLGGSDFQDDGGSDLGGEVRAGLAMEPLRGLTVMVEGGRFKGDGGVPDTDRLLTTLRWAWP